MSFATMLIKPAKQATVPHIGSKLLFQFSIRFKHQIHINKDGIIRVVTEENNG
jgi:proteasome assembly chaperone (PAC2) family protein